MDLCGSGKGLVAGTCKHGNKPSGSINVKKFLDQLSLTNFSRRTAPWS
jgi:hypothetical protein